MEIKKITPAFTDERGSIWDFLTHEEIHHIGFLTSKKGSIRGKHYHKEQKQYTLVFEGTIRVTIKNLQDSKSKIEVLDLNEMEMILIPSYYYHSLETIKDSKCFIFTSKSRDGEGYEEDTFRVSEIESFKLSK